VKKGLDFLVVEDDREFAALVAAILDKAGHRVRHAESGPAALKIVDERPPDCILLDIMIPGFDGLELLRRMRDREELAAVKIIVVSGKAYEFDRKRAYRFGADGYITKPVQAETLLGRIERFLADRIELTYWGVRGTLPVPGRKSLRYGGNTNCLTLEFANRQIFIFDAGTGIKELSNRLMSEKRRRVEGKIFITHPHWDHINALPFFAPLYKQGNDFEILGAAHGDIGLRDLISSQMDSVYFPVTIREFGAHVGFRELGEGETAIDNTVVKTMLLSHPGHCLGFRIEYRGRSVAVVTDNELYPESSPYHNAGYVSKLVRFVAHADLLITDCTYTDAEYPQKMGWGHSCTSEVVDLAQRAEVKALHLFHHDPDQTDADIDAKLEAARDMLGRRGSAVACLAPAEGQTFQI
jgi:phosphoribosyl 1,2-cyclic phosphodiesterase/CheY-like chemotaxis protein